MDAKTFWKHVVRDGFLYLEFNIIVSLIFLLFGSPVFMPFFEMLQNILRPLTIDGIISCICWVLFMVVLCWLEYKRGMHETRTGRFVMWQEWVQRLISIAFSLLPIAFYYGVKYFNYSPLAITYQPYMWLTPIFGNALWSGIIVGMATYLIMMAFFVLGRKRFVAWFQQKHGFLPNQDYIIVPKGAVDAGGEEAGEEAPVQGDEGAADGPAHAGQAD
nr:hypothetical protein [bacterium]